MSIKDLVTNIKRNGLLASMPQLEELYQVAIANEQKLAESEARCAQLAAENAGLREYRPQPSGAAMMEALDAFYEYHEYVPEQGMMAAFEILCCKRPETPATDAFLAEVRAQGVETAIDTAKNVVAQEFQYKDFETAQRVCSKFPESDLVGKVEMVEWLADFAAQLRKGGQS